MRDLRQDRNGLQADRNSELAPSKRIDLQLDLVNVVPPLLAQRAVRQAGKRDLRARF